MLEYPHKCRGGIALKPRAEDGGITREYFLMFKRRATCGVVAAGWCGVPGLPSDTAMDTPLLDIHPRVMLMGKAYKPRGAPYIYRKALAAISAGGSESVGSLLTLSASQSRYHVQSSF